MIHLICKYKKLIDYKEETSVYVYEFLVSGKERTIELDKDKVEKLGELHALRLAYGYAAKYIDE